MIQQSASAQNNRGSWVYREKRDEMRNETARFAMLENEGYVHINRGDDKVQLTLRRRHHEETIMLRTDSGIFTCDGHFKKTISVKFDTGSIEQLACSRPSDGSANVIFISPEENFIRKLRKSKKLIIEAEFYSHGPRQMTFLPEGLKW